MADHITTECLQCLKVWPGEFQVCPNPACRSTNVHIVHLEVRGEWHNKRYPHGSDEALQEAKELAD